FGGLIGEVEDGGTIELTMDLEELFDGWDVSSDGGADTAAGPAQVLRFSNTDPDASIATAITTVLESSWLPYGITILDRAGNLLMQAELLDLQVNTSLDPDDLRWYPHDAELIDERD